MKGRRAFYRSEPGPTAGADALVQTTQLLRVQTAAQSGNAPPLEETLLANPKFKIGQLVDFRPVRASFPASSREYKILRLLPREGVEQEYRIKSVTEIFERIARESELSRRS